MNRRISPFLGRIYREINNSKRNSIREKFWKTAAWIFDDKCGTEISHVFRYKGYIKKQRFLIWQLNMLRNFSDILSGIIGLITLGYIQTHWSCDISEKILRTQMKWRKEKENK